MTEPPQVVWDLGCLCIWSRRGITGRTYVAPQDSDEQALATIWQEVLTLSQIGIDDDFFELGGDSLAATRAFALTNQAFGTGLTLREMLDHPTIRGLAGLLASSRGTTPVRPPIRPRKILSH